MFHRYVAQVLVFQDKTSKKPRGTRRMLTAKSNFITQKCRRWYSGPTEVIHYTLSYNHLGCKGNPVPILAVRREE